MLRLNGWLISTKKEKCQTNRFDSSTCINDVFLLMRMQDKTDIFSWWYSWSYLPKILKIITEKDFYCFSWIFIGQFWHSIISKSISLSICKTVPHRQIYSSSKSFTLIFVCGRLYKWRHSFSRSHFEYLQTLFCY
jgi:hypothetical protein